jgi:glycosyltransferase involved in cell wall biosynthesis
LSNAEPAKIDLSVVIITLNEEKSLSRCINSLPKGCEIIVLDSGSSDATVEIAKKHKALVSTRAFDNYADQKNAAIDIASRNWVLSLDADEVLTDVLQKKIIKIISRPEHGGYRIRRRLNFMGKQMRFGKTIDYPVRLFRKERGRFKSDIHEKLHVDAGGVGTIYSPIDHYSYDDITDYFTRFNGYTSKVAANHLKNNKTPPPLVLHVMRPFVEFLNRYIFRFGFLDGYPGFCYALFSSTYTFVKYAKYLELQGRDTKA